MHTVNAFQVCLGDVERAESAGTNGTRHTYPVVITLDVIVELAFCAETLLTHVTGDGGDLVVNVYMSTILLVNCRRVRTKGTGYFVVIVNAQVQTQNATARE